MARQSRQRDLEAWRQIRQVEAQIPLVRRAGIDPEMLSVRVAELRAFLAGETQPGDGCCVTCGASTALVCRTCGRQCCVVHSFLDLAQGRWCRDCGARRAKR